MKLNLLRILTCPAVAFTLLGTHTSCPRAFADTATATAVPIQVEPARITYVPDSALPSIHYPKIVGATPGRPFLFNIPATGTEPLTYKSSSLPPGLTLDAHTGIISGALKLSGTTVVHLTVLNSLGVTHSQLTIVGGQRKLALTPPMGWNSWNVWANKVDEDKVKSAADIIATDGLAKHGYGYINIDDTWEGTRDSSGAIQTNAKFPDMKALASYVHARGLKIGIYSSPGPTTCGGYVASYQHEVQDASTYALWGFDYLKYDWCSYGSIDTNPDLAGFQKPYIVMRSALDSTNRDIVFSMCQYGMGNVWIWGADPSVGGNTWRTHTDIDDVWTGTSGWGSDRGIYDIIQSMIGLSAYAGPGHWNDPDMLMVGMVGFGNPHPSQLTPNEQITHVSAWCLFSAPLLIGCDLTKLDTFTRAILTNDEAIAINQDQLGKPAELITTTSGGGEIWARPLYDGSTALGLINVSGAPLSIPVSWKELGLRGRQKVRDLWLHSNVGTFTDGYSIVVPTHGTVLLKLSHG